MSVSMSRCFAFRTRFLVAAVLPMLLAAGCGKSPTAPVLPPLSSVVLSPAIDTLQVGQVRMFTATATDTGGAPVPEATFLWSSSDPGIFTVNFAGRVTGVGEGCALLIAEAGGLRDTAEIFVFAQAGWYAQTSSTSSTLNGVFFDSDGRNGWAVGVGGTIRATADAGVTWKNQVSNTGFNLQGVWFTSTGEGWTVGDAGTIRHLAPGDSIWTFVGSNASEDLLDVCFATPDTGWVVGAAGLILRTVDRGATWSRQLRGGGAALRSVSFAGTREGWAVGDGGVILGTHDRGLSWFTYQPSVTGLSLRSVWRRSESRAFAVGQQGVAPRTVSGPDSTVWELRTAGAANQLEGVFYPTDAIGYTVGFNGVGIVMRTDDGGLTWQSQTANSQFRLKDLFFVDAQRGWAVGESGVIIHTSRGGLP